MNFILKETLEQID